MDDFELTPAKAVTGGIIIVLIILGLTWVFQGNDFFLYKTFAPAEMQVRYDTQKNSQSYLDGKAEILAQDEKDYRLAKTDDEKTIIKTSALREAATVELTKLPSDIQAFVRELKSEQQ